MGAQNSTKKQNSFFQLKPFAFFAYKCYTLRMELSARKIKENMSAVMEIFVYDEVTSTNDVVKITGGAVFAKRQTAGRGRRGRTFYSGNGGLYFSLKIDVECGIMKLCGTELPFSPGRITIGAGIAVAKVLRLYGYDAKVKWVNDVYVQGKKVCGILAESGEECAVLGIGINLASTIPDELSEKAVSLGSSVDPNLIAASVIDALIAELNSPDIEFLRANCITIGKRVSTKFGIGIATDVDEFGVLEVQIGNETKKVCVGEAEIL